MTTPSSERLARFGRTLDIVAKVLAVLCAIGAVKQSPFLEENVKRLKIIGIILIIASLMLGLGNLIMALTVLALAYVFQYGTELQRAADETL